MLDRIEPVRIGAGVLEQAVARAKGPFERIDARHVLGIDRKHQPVEKAPSLRGWAVEQSVHGRHQPHHPEVIGECRGRWHRLAIDAVLARDYGVLSRRRRSHAGPERGQSELALHVGRHRP